MNIQEIRSQYPQYSDLSDDQLLKGLHGKFYSDMPYEDFTKSIAMPSGGRPVDIGSAGFPAALKQVLQETDWGTRNIAGAGTALTNLYQGIKQFAGKADPTQIEANRIIEQEAPVGAIAGNAALTAVPFSMVGPSLRAAGAVGGAYGLMQPIAGEQSLENIAKGKALNTAIGGASSVGGQALANKASSVLQNKLADIAAQKSRNAQRDATLKAAQELGLKVPPDMVNSSILNKILTGFSGKLTTQQNISAKNAEAINAIVRKDLNLPPNVALSDDVLNAYRNAKAGPYKEISALGDLPVDEAYKLGKLGPAVVGKTKPQISFVDEAGKVVSDVPSMPKAEGGRNLLNEIIKSGGISKSELGDMGIEGVKRPGLFRKEGAGQTADDLVEWMTQHGWLSVKEVANADKYATGGAHDLARTMVKDAIEGKPVFHPTEDYMENEFARQLSEWGGKYGTLTKKTIPGDPGKVNAADAVEKLKDLRYESKGYWQFFNRSGDPKARTAAKAYDSAAEQLEQFIERSAQNAGKGDLVPALREARKEIAKAHQISKALNDATGNVNARALAKEKYLTGDLKTVADFAKAFPKVAQSPEMMGSLPGISPLDFASGGLYGAAASAATGSPSGLLAAGIPFLRPVTRGLLSSDWYQSLLAHPNYGVGTIPRVLLGSGQYAPVGATALGLEAFRQ